MIGFRRILFRANGRNCVAEKNTVAAHVIADIVLLESVYANAERGHRVVGAMQHLDLRPRPLMRLRFDDAVGACCTCSRP